LDEKHVKIFYLHGALKMAILQFFKYFPVINFYHNNPIGGFLFLYFDSYTTIEPKPQNQKIEILVPPLHSVYIFLHETFFRWERLNNSVLRPIFIKESARKKMDRSNLVRAAKKLEDRDATVFAKNIEKWYDNVKSRSMSQIK
jgi:hypothetical protein